MPFTCPICNRPIGPVLYHCPYCDGIPAASPASLLIRHGSTIVLLASLAAPMLALHHSSRSLASLLPTSHGALVALALLYAAAIHPALTPMAIPGKTSQASRWRLVHARMNRFCFGSAAMAAALLASRMTLSPILPALAMLAVYPLWHRIPPTPFVPAALCYLFL